MQPKFARTTIRFACPGCGTKLRSSLGEVERPDSCPECSVAFKVPGPRNRESIASEDTLRIAAFKRKAIGHLSNASLHATTFGICTIVVYGLTANRHSIVEWSVDVAVWLIFAFLICAALVLAVFVFIVLPFKLLSASEGTTGFNNPLILIASL